MIPHGARDTGNQHRHMEGDKSLGFKMANLLNVLVTDNLQHIQSFFIPEETGVQKLDTLDLVFKLYTSGTVVFLILASGLLQIEQFAGSPIQCVHSTDDPEGLQVVATGSCWTNSTFVSTKVANWQDPELFGFGSDRCDSGSDRDCKFRLNYYQWTAFALLIQAWVFYLPRWIWNQCESGTLGSMVRAFSNLKDMKTRERRKMVVVLSEALLSEKHYWTFLSQFKVGLEVAMLVNLVLQVLFLDFFLGSFAFYFEGEGYNALTFHNLGLAMMAFWSKGHWGNAHQLDFSPGECLFPRKAKCDFFLYGRSGTPIQRQYICFLYLNNINEKTFTILWFWFACLGLALVSKLLFRLIRPAILRRFSEKKLQSACRRSVSDISDLEEPKGFNPKLIQDTHIPFGIMFILEILRRNCHPLVIKEATWNLVTMMRRKSN
eukprot:maker-scaffold129_size324999-snap-gene-0.13 protein:Tk10951 transcript:maker-scaffold129_size324999-snap-gene-0.13-mRNA-1 annotation:"innexin shaking-b isoform x1"